MLANSERPWPFACVPGSNSIENSYGFRFSLKNGFSFDLKLMSPDKGQKISILHIATESKVNHFQAITQTKIVLLNWAPGRLLQWRRLPWLLGLGLCVQFSSYHSPSCRCESCLRCDEPASLEAL